jgi:hypothetical protein
MNSMSDFVDNQLVCDNCGSDKNRNMNYIVNFGSQSISRTLHYTNTTTLWDPIPRRYRVCEKCIKSVSRRKMKISLSLLLGSILLSLIHLGFLFFVMVFSIALIVVLALPAKMYAAQLLKNKIFEDMQKTGFNIHKMLN